MSEPPQEMISARAQDHCRETNTLPDENQPQ